MRIGPLLWFAPGWTPADGGNGDMAVRHGGRARSAAKLTAAVKADSTARCWGEPTFNDDLVGAIELTGMAGSIVGSDVGAINTAPLAPATSITLGWMPDVDA